MVCCYSQYSILLPDFCSVLADCWFQCFLFYCYMRLMMQTMDSFAGNKLLFGSGWVDFLNKKVISLSFYIMFPCILLPDVCSVLADCWFQCFLFYEPDDEDNGFIFRQQIIFWIRMSWFSQQKSKFIFLFYVPMYYIQYPFYFPSTSTVRILFIIV